jgi:hypothetical protein
MERAGIVVGLVAGILIGYNWPKIKKALGPAAQEVGDQVSNMVTGGMRYAVEAKERLEDRLAEARAKKEVSPGAVPQGGNGAPVEGTA